MRILAISTDTSENSRAFAQSYGISFPLLADSDGAVSRKYTGITSDDNTLPGIVIVRGDGQVVFRQVASEKQDRIAIGDLVGAIDRSLGTHGPGLVDEHFAAIDRAQVRLDLGGGHLPDGATGVASLTALVPIGHYLVLGPRIGTDLRASPLALGGEVALRLPFWRDTAAVELGGIAGYAFDPNAALFGGTVDLWFPYSPRWSIQLGAEVDREAGATRITGTLGIGRLLEF